MLRLVLVNCLVVVLVQGQERHHRALATNNENKNNSEYNTIDDTNNHAVDEKHDDGVNVQDKFQKCCREEKLYSVIDRSCHLPTTQGPCKVGDWIVMDAKDDSGVGICRKAPCSNNQMVMHDGMCKSKFQGGLCSRGKRPWYSVYGDWTCKRHRVFLPFGQQKEPYDPAWDRCEKQNNGGVIIVS